MYSILLTEEEVTKALQQYIRDVLSTARITEQEMTRRFAYHELKVSSGQQFGIPAEENHEFPYIFIELSHQYGHWADGTLKELKKVLIPENRVFLPTEDKRLERFTDKEVLVFTYANPLCPKGIVLYCRKYCK